MTLHVERTYVDYVLDLTLSRYDAQKIIDDISRWQNALYPDPVHIPSPLINLRAALMAAMADETAS